MKKQMREAAATLIPMVSLTLTRKSTSPTTIRAGITVIQEETKTEAKIPRISGTWPLPGIKKPHQKVKERRQNKSRRSGHQHSLQVTSQVRMRDR